MFCLVTYAQTENVGLRKRYSQIWIGKLVASELVIGMLRRICNFWNWHQDYVDDILIFHRGLVCLREY